jgi:drug/metabolite transporter (DMT)-like permease
MDSPHLWVGIVLIAVVAQTVRNFAQRSVGRLSNPWSATLVRFLYGLPFTALVLAILLAPMGPLPPLSGLLMPTYWIWLCMAMFAQVMGTAWLLMSMSQSNFVIAIALSKTELLQIVLFSLLILHQATTMPVLISIVLVCIGLLILASQGRPKTSRKLVSRSVLLGIGSGSGFALAAMGFREAGLILLGGPHGELTPLLAGVFNLFLAQVAQSAVLCGWLAWRDRPALLSIMVQWRESLGAGFAGAVASMAWFTAYLLRPVADVRTLGMLEIVLSYLVSRRLLKERTTWRELVAIFLISTGAVVTALYV